MLYNFILCIGACFVLMNILAEYKRYGTTLLIFSPVTLFSVFFLLIHIITPLWKASGEYWRHYYFDYPDGVLIQTAFITVFSYQFCVLLLSKILYRRNFTYYHSNKRHSFYTSPQEVRLTFLIALISFIFGAYGVLINQASLGQDFLSDRISVGVGNGLTRLLPNFLISSSILYAYLVFVRNDNVSRTLKKLSLIALLIVVGLGFYYFNRIQSRNSILILFILIVSLYLFLRPAYKINNRIIKQFFVVMMVLLPVLVGFKAMTVNRYTVVDSSYSQAKLDNLYFNMIDGAFGNDEQLIWMMSYSDLYEYQLGGSYVAAVTNFVPRAIWKDKPLGGGPRLKNMIHPGSYVVGESKNSSLTTGLYTEAWMNFGGLGVPMILMLWGMISLFVTRKIQYYHNSVKALPWITFLILWSTLMIYSEFTGFVVRAVFIISPLLTVRILERALNRLHIL